MKLYEYWCLDCDLVFYLKKVIPPDQVHCPTCGECNEVSISSKHLDDLYKNLETETEE